MTIKGVVFMTFWQSSMVNIIFHASNENSENMSNDVDDSAAVSDTGVYSASYIQHVLICMEMLLFSAAHWCVFPAEEWEDGYKIRFYEGPLLIERSILSHVIPSRALGYAVYCKTKDAMSLSLFEPCLTSS